MQLRDAIDRIRFAEQAVRFAAHSLREGMSPTEIAAGLDGLADRLGEAAATPPGPTDPEARLAVLEERQRQDSGFAQRVCLDLAETDQRLDDLAAAMREAAKREALHPSVRFLADTIALNLSAPTVADNGDQIATMADTAYERAKQRATGGQGV